MDYTTGTWFHLSSFCLSTFYSPSLRVTIYSRPGYSYGLHERNLFSSIVGMSVNLEVCKSRFTLGEGIRMDCTRGTCSDLYKCTVCATTHSVRENSSRVFVCCYSLCVSRFIPGGCIRIECKRGTFFHLIHTPRIYSMRGTCSPSVYICHNSL